MDSSCLVKRYVNEIGSGWVLSITALLRETKFTPSALRVLRLFLLSRDGNGMAQLSLMRQRW